jgi:hypothetical protein
MAVAVVRVRVLFVVLACVLTFVGSFVSVPHAEPLTAADGGLISTIPANLTVPGALRPLLEEMLRRSPTFRLQLLKLRRAPHVKMAIRYGDVSTWHVLRAESTVSRYEWGALQVDTQLYTARDVIEVIAHELEHVCEQIDGVDVRRLSQRRHSGVYTVGPHFETQRAIMIGRQVAREALGVTVGAVLPPHPTE